MKKTVPTIPRRMRLDQALIIKTAMELIEKHGEADVSTRMIGKALGAEAMAIYHYFPSRDALLDAVTGALVAGIEWPAATGDWRLDLRRAAEIYYGVAKSHPHCFPLLTSRRFNRPETLPTLNHIFSILARAGLQPASVATAFRILGYFLSGAGLAYGATLSAGTRSDFQLNNPDFLASYPIVAATMPHLAHDQLDRIFAIGLDAMLDRIARMVEDAASARAD